MKSAYLRGLVPLALLLAGALGAVSPPQVGDGPLPGAEVYRHTLRSVAWVHAAGQGQGTGWLVDGPRPWLVT